MDKLNRFIEAQDGVYERALEEIKNGRKKTHWMWYIFPQIKGLGMSEVSKYYGIDNLEEAKAYLNNDVLGFRLREISTELLTLDIDNPEDIFGSIDSMKLKSSMTLFESASGEELFGLVLEKFYGGKRDERTILLLEKGKEFIYKK